MDFADLLVSIASPPSDLNGRFSYIFIYLYVTGTPHTVMLYVLLILRAHSPARQQCVAFNYYHELCLCCMLLKLIHQCTKMLA